MGNVEQFLQSPAFGVVGASSNQSKFGNKVLRCYLAHDMKAYPVNPFEERIEGLACVKEVADLPEEIDSLSVITPPAVTEKIVEQAIAKGIKNVWMQPGAESDAAIEQGIKHGINVIARGPCILVVLGFDEWW
ncbi:CoA-binding protein [Legionella birminghamensis]|uniref:CoA-binding protein n=1 Tax=Legionella birminghamensis TaxID=28083 RepID=A0A378IAZ1_9GAMM|nr:CoA-binding protein [Legionella birminghamensis]KTC75629.1 CoA-binding protein [Legionella birminghamensis]STX31952.1 CoA-binding protein [Legionella birminghamensis]